MGRLDDAAGKTATDRVCMQCTRWLRSSPSVARTGQPLLSHAITSDFKRLFIKGEAGFTSDFETKPVLHVGQDGVSDVCRAFTRHVWHIKCSHTVSTGLSITSAHWEQRKLPNLTGRMGGVKRLASSALSPISDCRLKDVTCLVGSAH